MKKYFPYLSGLILSTLVLGLIAFSVPPEWAMCKCTYNEIKSFLVFPGSSFASIIVILLTYLRVRSGQTFWKTLFANLIFFALLFGVLGFLIHPIAEYVEENDIPIFQPDFSDELL